jgi:hypothetical protein
MTCKLQRVSKQLQRRLKWIAGFSLLLSTGLVSPTTSGAVANNSKPSIGPAFTTQINDVWNSISTNSLGQALTNFFPGSAYVHMKQGVLANPSGDFSSRLLAFFKLDFAAYHQLIVSGGPSKFISVQVNPAQISWISVGACENKIGYWHLGPVRVVYEQAGVVKSFAIASLISWNGVWKIIHLGPNPRAKNIGTVASPALGPGSPGPGGGC